MLRRPYHLNCCSSFRDSRTRSFNFWRSAIASRVYFPCFRALRLPRGAPDPGAPPCIRQRFLPWTAGDPHGFPERVLAPQRGQESIGPVLRLLIARLIHVAHEPEPALLQ